ncbi:MAG: response regulator [Acidobacteriaceae bacterium]|nr:response regulator [Acidobacteriaceae bacterium]
MILSKNDQPRVLLIDHDFRSQQLRTAALRNCEIEVHLAGNLDEAARLWAKHCYNLVLLAAPQNSEEVAVFSSEVNKCKPRPRMALLVGAPEYVREVGRVTPRSLATLAPMMAVTKTDVPHSHWHAMLQQLLATA